MRAPQRARDAGGCSLEDRRVPCHYSWSIRSASSSQLDESVNEEALDSYGGAGTGAADQLSCNDRLHRS